MPGRYRLIKESATRPQGASRERVCVGGGGVCVWACWGACGLPACLPAHGLGGVPLPVSFRALASSAHPPSW
mgnify:CR=1 FL=1